MTLPNFLIVGAEKAGTTTLAATLSRHPDIFMCDPKEPRFFSHNWHKGLDWYKSLFVTGEGFQTVGEASPAYTCAPVISDVPQRIYDVLGDVKYIYIVRHPVDRIISHYRHAIQYRWIPASTPLEHSYELAPSLKNCSRYYYQVERYFPYTKRSQWHIVVLEELIQSPQPVMDALFEFLGLPRHVISELPHENKSNNKRRCRTNSRCCRHGSSGWNGLSYNVSNG